MPTTRTDEFRAGMLSGLMVMLLAFCALAIPLPTFRLLTTTILVMWATFTVVSVLAVRAFGGATRRQAILPARIGLVGGGLLALEAYVLGLAGWWAIGAAAISWSFIVAFELRVAPRPLEAAN